MTTVANLITRIRNRVDLPTTDSYVTDANLILMISDSACALDDMLIATYDDYKVTLTGASTITAPTATTNFFALPTSPAFLKARAVYRVEGSELVPLDRAPMGAVWPLDPGSRGFGLTYRIEGANVWIDPWAASAGSYRMRYVPAMTALTATSDSLASHMDVQAWHAFITEDVSAKILMKQDLDASQFLALRQEAKQRIIDAAQPRDAGPPKRAYDARGVRRGTFPARRRWLP